jgi:glycosyltransferase involved in cell wall biosynthesis
VSRRVLVVSENESVLRDRRVRTIARSLHRAGFEVVVVSPEAHAAHDAEVARDGIELAGYTPSFATGGPLAYAREYAVALWRTWRLVRRLAAERRFDIVHVCNPPDFMAVAIRPLRRAGARVVFDHHDLVPELYLARFGRGRDLLYRLTFPLERVGFRLADVVIATNDSYRDVAVTRGRKSPDQVFVVRNAPDLSRFRPGPPDPALRRGKPHLISYVGAIAPQDGVDHALRALALLRERRDDWRAIFAGDGAALAEMQLLANELALKDAVEFTGWLGDDELVRVLSTSDVCLAPDPKNPFSDASTMVKILEYMAMGRPIVSYDLRESRASAREAALYAIPNDVRSFAGCIEQLLDDPRRRQTMGAFGRRRVERELSWTASERELLAAYETVLANGRRPEASAAARRS